MKTKYIVETLVTFHEYHVVEAENVQQAIDIAENSDYNTSVHLGNQILSVYEQTEQDIKRISDKDQYFFNGYATVDEEGQLVYMKNDGTVNGNMPKTKIF